ncbi:hypothetical protein AOQ84DRAFT_378579 [Glonium stellatum]|uniref:Uncharacterized protein n=1 Tax=Glonium stellatum TaxID=574774 RepID=A0A8E2EWZ7_9PEZI|nr:hypothetical protein AOQ84DRAFT_378579 [Glonium stellatum]
MVHESGRGSAIIKMMLTCLRIYGWPLRKHLTVLIPLSERRQMNHWRISPIIQTYLYPERASRSLLALEERTLFNDAVSSPTADGDNDARKPASFNQAISYVDQVKKTYTNQPGVYLKFLEILQMYQVMGHSIDLVYAQISILFAGDPIIIQGFLSFLPASPNKRRHVLGPESLNIQLLDLDTALEKLDTISVTLRYLDKLVALCAEHKPGIYSQFSGMIGDSNGAAFESLRLYRLISDMFAHNTIILSGDYMFSPSLQSVDQIPSASKQKYFTDDWRQQTSILVKALDYLDDLEGCYGFVSSTEPKVYLEFLKIMGDVREQELDALGFLDRATKLLADNASLVQRLGIFLPTEYTIRSCSQLYDSLEVIVDAPTGTKTYRHQVQRTRPNDGID